MKNGFKSLLLKKWLKYFSRIFSAVFILGFIVSNLVQSNFWSIQTASAEFDGLGAKFSSSNGSDWSVVVTNNGDTFQGGQQITAQFGAYHCKTASTAPCSNASDPDFDRTLKLDTNVPLTVPAKGQSITMTFHNDPVTCGRVQADLGMASTEPGGAIFGGTTIPVGGNCTTPPPPAPSCSYTSTQARWQQNINDPWGQNKTITLGQSANVGSFHNNTGQFATDTTLTVTGPGTNTTLSNSQSFTPSQAGTFTLTVTTNGQSGAACTDTATLTVNLPAPQCTYSSTQARWQKDINDPWDSSKSINLGQSARAGGFHNNTGQFANDVTLTVTGPGTNTPVGQGGTFTPAQAGTYQLKVTTNGQSGAACEDTATLTVQAAPQCTWTSTQARVQKNLSDPWESSKTINSGEQIRVGGFHNATGQFANDVNLNVTGPQNFSNLSNGAFITPNQAGNYTLAVTTNGQSGAACQDTATFQVNATVCTPNGSCSAPTPDCNKTTTGVDNCGNVCTKTGEACKPGCTPNGSCSAPEPACGTVTSGVDNCGNACFRPGPGCPGQGGNVTNNITNNNNNTNNNSSSSSSSATGGSSSSSSSSTSSSTGGTPLVVTTGNVGVGTSVLGVTMLPKTGLPEIAWSALAFIPTGLGIRRFRKVKQDLKDHPQFIWEDRKFKSGS